MASANHARSVSFPPKINPIVQNIEQELKKLQKSEASSISTTETIAIGLTGLAGLYKCVDDALNLPLPHHYKPLLLEGSSKVLEICTASTHILLRLIGAVTNLRRSNCDQADISGYLSLRKEVIRSTKGVALSLKQVEGGFLSEFDGDKQGSGTEVIRALRCVSIINISVVESLLGFLGKPISKPKSRNLGLVLKLVRRKSSKGVSEEDDEDEKLGDQSGNELSNVDVVLLDVDDGKKRVLVAQKKLEVLEGVLRRFEGGLSNIVRQLTRTRASLVNIISV